MVPATVDEIWVGALSLEDLKAELTRRSLAADGNEHILRDRLLRTLRHEGPSVNNVSTEIDSRLRDNPVDGINNAMQLLNTSVHQSPHSPHPEIGERRRASNPFRHDTEPLSPLVYSDRRDSDTRGAIPRYTRNFGTPIYDIMRKWNLQFSGARREDAESFLIRIEEGRAMIPVADADILRCLPFFLSGMALHWFRSHRERWCTWDDFERAWRTRFGDPDLQFSLREEIFYRTQGEYESVADFFTCLHALFDRLQPKWSEAEEINYAHRNLLPRLQIAVHRNDVNTLDALETVARRIERSFRLAQNYRGPPTPERSYFPDLAYRASRNPSRNNHAFLANELPSLRDSRLTRPSYSSPVRDRNQQTSDHQRLGNARRDHYRNRSLENRDRRQSQAYQDRSANDLPYRGRNQSVSRNQDSNRWSNNRQNRDSRFHPQNFNNNDNQNHNRSFRPHNPNNPPREPLPRPITNTNPFLDTDNSPPDTVRNSMNSSTHRDPTACWNCGQTGHRSQRCPQPRRMHCFRCGKPGVTKNNCSCSGNV